MSTTLTRALGAVALMLSQGTATPAQDQPAKKEKVPPAKIAGAVKAVDAQNRSLTVTLDDQTEKTCKLSEKVMITLHGPILDGIRAGDRVELIAREGDNPEVLRISVTREGVSPGAKVKVEKKVNAAPKEGKRRQDGVPVPPPLE